MGAYGGLGGGGREGEGGMLHGDYFTGESFGGGFRHPWETPSSNCLMHTLTCRLMLRSEP